MYTVTIVFLLLPTLTLHVKGKLTPIGGMAFDMHSEILLSASIAVGESNGAEIDRDTIPVLIFISALDPFHLTSNVLPNEGIVKSAVDFSLTTT